MDRRTPLFAALALAGVTLFLGCCCAGGDPPDRTVLTVTTACTGLDAESVEWSVTQPLEVAAVQMGGLERMESVSSAGLSSIDVTLAPATDRFREAEQLASRMDLAELPDRCDPPTLGLGDPAARVALEVALVGDGPAVEAAALDLRMEWLAMGNVDGVLVRGLPERQVRIAMDPARAAALGIDVNDLIAAIDGGGVWPIDDLRSLALGVEAPGVTVGDVAEVVLDQAWSCGRSWLDGEPAVVMSALRIPEKEAIEMENALTSHLEPWVRDLPPGVAVTVLSDDDLTIEVTAPGPLTPWDLDGIGEAIEELGASRVVLDLGVGGSGRCESDPNRARFGVAWAEGMPAQARDELRRAADSVPMLASRVALPSDPVVAVAITAEDLYVIDEVTDAVHDRLSTVPGLLETWDDRSPSVDEIRVIADRQAVAACGIQAWQVEQAALAATDGVPVSRMEVDGSPVSFVVTVGDDARGSDLPSLLREVLVRTGDRRAAIPLQDLASVEISRSASSVRRLHLMRTVTVYVRHEPLTLTSEREVIAAALSEIELPAGVSVNVEP
jgi:multidrug efflux pump subunit AcrB